MSIWQDGDLNEEQIDAIEETDSVFLVACPGSGKTRTVTFKIAYELSKIESDKEWVVAITYTNRAAGEIQDRIELMGISTEQLWIGTIHAFCLEWIIKPYGIYHSELKNGYRIINSHDTEMMLTEICSSYSNPRTTHWDCDHFFDSNGINIRCTNNRRNNVESILTEYDEILRSNKQIDFERILWFSYQLITTVPKIAEILSKLFKYILIDEFQDTKEIQYQIVSSILRAGNGLVKAFVVGDPNQSIFNSLGGYAISQEEFSSMSSIDFKPLELSKNYRNSQRIVDYFSNFKVFDSTITSEADHREYGSLISFNSQLPRENVITEISRLIRLSVEQYQIPMSEVCVVGPWWIHLASLTRGLIGELPDYRFDGPGLTPFVRDAENIFYKLSRIVLTKPSPTVYVRRLRWAKEIIQYFSDIGIDTAKITPKQLLKIVNSINILEQDGLIFLSQFFDDIFNALNVEWSEYKALDEHRTAFFDSATSRIQRIQSEGINYAGDVEAFYKAFEPRDGVTVSTIHGVKGAEYDVVIAFALLEGAVPHFNDPNLRESANKLLYVICSRARKNLHLISETGRNQNNPTQELQLLNYQYSAV
ncbi:ATP-dependent DNA helicase PcrA [Marinomonas gallaica]|uniref:DNA 3'-5' helicase n=1 Tax=Marinomonas gallaica TaxID=1806667 RepID=A0A1C3JR29_9GAMM|nr:ATP-dependent helicase [Marinomonas gallaica]SBT17701.1 ATP-dependent DNA helicase PcrA [Marinomonas gallaica]SBT20027.1 ATP-dependent DNA helicase PcrA [Marinomonas gallaica]